MLMETPKQKPVGLVCHKCGCRRFEVERVKHVEGAIRRTRACKECGQDKVTFERDAFSGREG